MTSVQWVPTPRGSYEVLTSHALVDGYVGSKHRALATFSCFVGLCAVFVLLLSLPSCPCSPLSIVGIFGGGRELAQRDFDMGTVRITRSGRYTLTEDIVFDPRHPNATWSGIPLDCEAYPQRAGYFLGFFAAVVVEAGGVELDCLGHEIKMSGRFHRLQRFFAVIELGSAPFLKGQGTSPFKSSLTTPAEPTFARDVKIKNCRLGLSSHHSIHGNSNDGVTLEHVQMYDFEVAGVALSGATRVRMDGLTVGPSLKQTFAAELAQGIFMDHIASSLMRGEPEISRRLQSTRVKLRGEWASVASILAKLRAELQEYVQSKGGPLRNVFGDGGSLPDGSAIYGLLLHRNGFAIDDFGFCPDDGPSAEELMVSDVTLRNIAIRGLSVRVDQATATEQDGSVVMGPGGDIFKTTENWDATNCYAYTGSSFSDAQIALGVLRKRLTADGVPTDTIKFFLGSSNIPEVVQRWAASDLSCQETMAWVQELIQGKGKTRLRCNQDAMSHVNKGVVGMRLSFQKDISVRGVTIADLTNAGVENAAPYCDVTGATYQGLDVRGVSLAHVKDMHDFEVDQEGDFSSANPERIFPVTRVLQMRADDANAMG